MQGRLRVCKANGGNGRAVVNWASVRGFIGRWGATNRWQSKLWLPLSVWPTGHISEALPCAANATA